MEEAKDGGVMDDGDGVKRSPCVHSSKTRGPSVCVLAREQSGRVQPELPDPANSFHIELRLPLRSPFPNHTIEIIHPNVCLTVDSLPQLHHHMHPHVTDGPY